MRDKGKPHMVAMVACMNKLTHIIFALLKTGKAFDLEYEKRIKAVKSEKTEGKNATDKRIQLLQIHPSAPVSKKMHRMLRKAERKNEVEASSALSSLPAKNIANST